MAGRNALSNRHRSIGLPQHPGTSLEHAKVVLDDELEPSIEDRAYAVHEALQATTAELRKLINRLRDSIPLYADTLYVMNPGDSVAYMEQVYGVNILRVTSFFLITPTGSTSVTLQLGARPAIGLPSGLCPLSPCSFVHRAEDRVQLTIVPAISVPATLWLMGQQLPEVDF